MFGKLSVKVIVVFLVNVVAFGFIAATVYSEVELAFFIKLFVPMTAIFGTNLATVLTFLSLSENDSKK